MPAGAHGLDPHFMSAVPFPRARGEAIGNAERLKNTCSFFAVSQRTKNSCNKKSILPSLVWLRSCWPRSKINVAGTHWDNDPIMTVETRGTWAMRGVLA